MASLKTYRVRVLASDGRPGAIPFTYHLDAESRDEAISIVRKRMRLAHGKVVKHVDFARQVTAPVA